MAKLLSILTLFFIILQFGLTPIFAQKSQPEFVKAFEQDLFNAGGSKTFKNSVIPRIDTSKYTDLELKWHGKIGDNACMVYHGSYQSKSKPKTDNIAIKMVSKNGNWIVHALNKVANDREEFYDRWLKAQGCKDS